MHTEAEDWTDKRLGEARRAQQPAVTHAVTIRMMSLLKGKLGEAPLTAVERVDTAKALLGDMATPGAPDVQAGHEN